MRESFVQLEQMLPLMKQTFSQGGSVSFMPKGTSMLPLLRQGVDSVTLSALPEQLKKYDLPLYRRENGQFVIHRIVKTGSTYTCMGDNQFAAEKGLSREQMVAIVTAVHRGDRHVDVSGLSYKIYCRMWHWSRPVRRIWRGMIGRLRRRYER